MNRYCREYALLLLLVLVMVLTVPGQTGAQPADQSAPPTGFQAAFDEANRLYGDGEYEKSIEAYDNLVRRGVVDRDLYYNLGNAYYKNGQLGRAVLYYERARRLSPRDRDIRENLSHVESMLRDRQFIMEENQFKRAVMWLNRNFNTGESVMLTSLLYLVFCLLAVVFISRRSSSVGRLYRRFSILSPGRFLGLTPSQDLLLAMLLSAGLLVGSSLSTWQKLSVEKRQSRAVVIRPEAAVYSGPTRESTLQFKIHEGTRTTIRSRRMGWAQIDLPGDLTGWVIQETVEEI